MRRSSYSKSIFKQAGKVDRKGRPLVFSETLHADASAVEFDDVACDGEAEAHAAMPADAAAVRLSKAIKDIRKESVFDSLSAVLHAKLRMKAGAMQTYPYIPAAGSELDRVAHEVPDHLLQAMGIAENQAVRLGEFLA